VQHGCIALAMDNTIDRSKSVHFDGPVQRPHVPVSPESHVLGPRGELGEYGIDMPPGTLRGGVGKLQ